VIELRILTGPQAGAVVAARRFPFRLGRSAGAHFCLEERGVFARHAEIRLDPAAGFWVIAHPGAILSVNGQPAREARLRNGDVIGLGAAQLRFGLGPAPQRGLGLREALTWLGLLALCLAQVALIYGLMSWAGGDFDWWWRRAG
jgi:hypothetical protein